MPIIIDLTKNADINPVHMGVVIIVTLGVRADHAALRVGAADGVEIRRHKILEGDGRIAADLRRLLRGDRVCIFFPDIVLWLPKTLLPQSVGCFPNPNGAGYICP